MNSHTLTDGTKMPALGLGTWKSEPDAVYHAVRAAIEVGYRHIDCAAVYQNEQDVGRALRDALDAGDVTREEIWITSKLWNDAHALEDVRPALEMSLRKLQLDYLDLYLIHWPVALRAGVGIPRTPGDLVSLRELPLEATWEGMLAVADEGLSRQVGVSNFNTTHIERVRKATGRAPAVNQIELHPYLQQEQLLAACQAMGVHVTAYSPLGSPDSAAMFRREDGIILTEHPAIVEIANAREATPGQVLIAWALARGTSVIPKSVNPGRIAENLRAQDVTLTTGDMEVIASLEAHRRMVGGDLWFLGGTYSKATLWGK